MVLGKKMDRINKINLLSFSKFCMDTVKCCTMSIVPIISFTSEIEIITLVLQILSQSCPTELLQACLTLCDPVDCSLPGSSVHGIL